MTRLSSRQKTSIVFFYDLIITILAFSFSLFLLEPKIGHIFNHPWRILMALGLTTASQISVFSLTGVYSGIWRYSSTYDLIRLIKASTMAIALSFLILYMTSNIFLFPRSFLVIDLLILIIGMGGGRLAYRVWRDGVSLKSVEREKEYSRVVIVGAGSRGEQLYREIKDNISLNMHVCGFVDDDINKQGRKLHGIQVVGGVESLRTFVKNQNIDRVLIAIPSASSEQIKKILRTCKDIDINFSILPKMSTILNGKIEFSSLRNVSIEDLVHRKEIKLEKDLIGKMIENKVILVTGAGGSIGSEICRQIASFKPKKLVLYEITELFLYQLERSLNELYPQLEYISVIGDIRDLESSEKIFKDYQPELVFHAAAYKHVPMMEKNPHEAIKTNIFGTKNTAQLSLKYLVERFVMISTDKAINPTSVMGTTKRVAEMICQDYQSKSNSTKFMTVRFGNVLGSSGSVLPLFKEQIEKGEDLTVTHKDMKRYFMSIPEASQLVLQAGSLGNGGEILVLDMGEPILIQDIAKQMIELAGLKLGKDINIKYTGLRPGEKLYEELLSENEMILPTRHNLVKVARSVDISKDFELLLSKLNSHLENKASDDLISILEEIVPEYSIFKQKMLNNMAPSISQCSQ